MRRGAPGEPAFVHPQPGCLSAAAWGGFARVLDSRFEELEAESLVEEVRSGIETRLVERLGEAARHDELVAGDESVRRSMASGDVELAIVASDHETLDAWTREADAPVFAPLAGARLGEAVGVDRLAAVGIVPGPRADVVGRDAEKLICLEFDET
jgi:ribosomal protein L7Ae-like RNA K-turn-binding protein